MKKSIIFLVTVISVLLVYATIPAFAMDENVSLLEDLGILNEPPVSRVIVKGFTRSDFAKAVAVMDGSVPMIISDDAKTYADDIAKDPNFNSIVKVISLGYMSVEEGKFRPNGSITQSEAAAALVKALGYDSVAKENGGKDSDYILLASRLGIFKGVKIKDANKLTYEEAGRMIYNTMGLPHYAGDLFVKPLDRCFFDNWSLTKYSGKILANATLGIGVDRARSGHVNIDGEIIKTDILIEDSYVGRDVTYYTRGTDDEKTVVSITGAEKTDVETVYSADIVKVEYNGSVYRMVYNDSEELEIAKTAFMLVNGKTVSPSTELFNAFKSGTVTFLDTNRDGIYDVGHMSLLQQGIIEGISEDASKMVVRIKDTLNTINLKDMDVIEVYKGKKTAALNDLDAGMVVGVCVDNFTVDKNGLQFHYANSKMLKLFASSRVENGFVETVDKDETVCVDEVEFPLGAAYKDFVKARYISDIKAGTKVYLYLDCFGEVVSWETDSNGDVYSYGYIIKASVEKNGLDRELAFKVLNQNGDIVTYQTKKASFILDGVKTDVKQDSTVYAVGSGSVDLSKRQLIRYRAEENVMREIDTKLIRPGVESKEGSLNASLPFDFYSEGQQASKIQRQSVGKKFIIPDNCIVFVDEGLATGSVSDKDFSVQGASVISSSGEYYVEGFDATEKNELPVVVYYSQYGMTESAAVRQSLAHHVINCFIIDKVTKSMKNEEMGWMLTLYGPQGRVERFVPENTVALYQSQSPSDWGEKVKLYRVDISQFDATLKSGDIIRFTTTTSGDINYIEKLFDFEKHKDSLLAVPEGGGTKYGFARVEKTYGDVIKYNYKDIGDKESYVLKKRTEYAVVPVYNVSTGKVAAYQYKDLPSEARGDDVKVFLRYYDDTYIFDYIFYLYE